MTITGVDDDGEAGGEVRVVVPAQGALTFTAGELEAGGEGLEGALGDGAGKWRLFVEAEGGQGSALPWILAMSLLEKSDGPPDEPVVDSAERIAGAVLGARCSRRSRRRAVRDSRGC